MLVPLGNPTRWARTGMHVTTLALPDRLLHPYDGAGALKAIGARGAGSEDWCQWWPLVGVREREAGGLGWTYPSGYLRYCRVAFPTKVDAGVERSIRSDQIDLRHFSEQDATIVKESTAPVLWTPETDTFGQLRATQFTLRNGYGDSVSITLDPRDSNELYPAWHDRTQANVRVYRQFAKMQVADPTQRPALWLELVYEIQRSFDHNGRVVRVGYRWGIFDQDKVDYGWTFGNRRVELDISPHPDPAFPYERAMLPETAPTIYSQDGRTVISAGSGSSMFKKVYTVEGEGGETSQTNRFTNVALFEPADRNYLSGVNALSRQQILGGSGYAGYCVLAFPEVGADGAPLTQQDRDTIAAESEARLFGISADWSENQDSFGNHGTVPDPNARHSFANDREAFEAAMNHANDEYLLHTYPLANDDIEQYVNGTGPDIGYRDPLHRSPMGPRPWQPQGGDSAGFGVSKGFMHAAIGCGDLRAMELSALWQLSACGFDYREPDGDLVDPASHIAPTLTNFRELAMPMHNGYPFADVDRGAWNGVSYFQGSFDGLGKRDEELRTEPRGFIYGSSGLVSDERHYGGFEGSHQDINNYAAWVLVSGNHLGLWAMEGAATSFLASHWCTAPERDAEFFRLYDEPEDNKAALAKFARKRAREVQTGLYCARILGDRRCERRIRETVLYGLMRYAFGSDARTLKWWDPARKGSRTVNPGNRPLRTEAAAGDWSLYCGDYANDGNGPQNAGSAGNLFDEPTESAFQISLLGYSIQSIHRYYSDEVRREQTSSFTPLDLGSLLWAWIDPGDNGEYVDRVPEGPGDREIINRVRDRSPNGRDFIGVARDGTGVDRRPGYDGDPSISWVHHPAGSYSPGKPAIGVERWVGHDRFGKIYRQDQSLGATGQFYLATVVTNIRDAGSRDAFGTDSSNYLTLDQGAGHLYAVCAGQTQIRIAQGIIRGPLLLEVWRDGSNRWHVYANGVEIGNGTILGGTFNVSGFGWSRVDDVGPVGSTGTAYWDDWVFSAVMCRGTLSEAQRDSVREFLRNRFNVYGAAQPTSDAVEIVAFTSRWLRRLGELASRCFMSSNTVPGDTGDINWPAFFLTVRERLLTDAEMTFDGNSTSGNAQNVVNGEGYWQASSTWSIFKQYVGAIFFGIAYTDDTDSKNRAIAILQRNLPELLENTDTRYQGKRSASKNPHGWGAYMTDNGQLDGWLHVMPGVLGPYTPTSNAEAHYAGSVAITATARVHRMASAHYAGEVAITAIGTPIPNRNITNAAARYAGTVKIEARPTAHRRAAAHYAGTVKIEARATSHRRASAHYAGTVKIEAGAASHRKAEARYTGQVSIVANADPGGHAFAHYAGQVMMTATPRIHRRASAHYEGAVQITAAVRLSASAAYVGQVAMTATPRLHRRGTADYEGSVAMTATGTPGVPARRFARANYEGEVAISATGRSHVPTRCEAHYEGFAFMTGTPRIVAVLAEPTFVSDAQAAFHRMVGERGFEITYYPDGEESQAKKFHVIVDYDGRYYDGTVLHTVEGVTVHVPNHPEACESPAENDLIDVPMRPGRPTSRARVVDVVDQDELKFVLQVKN